MRTLSAVLLSLGLLASGIALAPSAEAACSLQAYDPANSKGTISGTTVSGCSSDHYLHRDRVWGHENGSTAKKLSGVKNHKWNVVGSGTHSYGTTVEFWEYNMWGDGFRFYNASNKVRFSA